MDHMVSISALSQGQASKVLNKVTDEHEIIILKNNQAKAVIISPDQFRSYAELAEICNAIIEEKLIPEDKEKKIRALLKRTKLYTEE
ncbi:MAG: type II toxin-antitoxin system Phd/YefM family antitoxin [Oscillospiraceae bacterium]|nr:type II toxin-antitoxin system Phd/YefM family antitoxin [Oscillospiraceae bacterium]